MKRRVAVIGGGIAGISAAFRLMGRCEVTLIERENRLGGHANPVSVKQKNDTDVRVDTGFIIFNQRSYPRYIQLLKDLDAFNLAATAPMSVCFEHESHGLFSSTSLIQLFTRAVSDRRLRSILFELPRFRKEARTLVGNGEAASLSVKAFASAFSPEFRELFLFPLGAVVWSMPRELFLRFPARTVAEFLDHHGHLGDSSGKRWMSFSGSSASYLEAFKKRFQGRLILGEEIRRITSLGEIHGPGIGSARFDHVIIAAPAHHAYTMLEAPTDLETRTLGAMKYSPNTVTLHTDPSSLPGHSRDWAAWNVKSSGSGGYLMNYHLNQVHGLRGAQNLFSGLNAAPDPAHVLGSYRFEHPVLDSTFFRRKDELVALNQQGGRLGFCGSYFGYGFHEDAVVSAERMILDTGL